MKVAVVYNARDGQVVNAFGMQNKEWYPPETVVLVTDALKNAGHAVRLIQGDRFLLSNLAEFLADFSRTKTPVMVFNLALGIQGRCRYTHIPAILEMAGFPYTGSSPLGHALALDKVITKQVFIAAGLPTPRFAVMGADGPFLHSLRYPLVVKPRSEAASMGVTVASNERILREAVADIQATYRQEALVEELIEGRELNVSLYGNFPPQILPILELQMKGVSPNIYTHELKFNHSGVRVDKICPADLTPGLAAHIRDLSLRAFRALNLYDHARIDIRLDKENNPYLLEINSMVSINPASSFIHAAKTVGISYEQLINKILAAALERYARDAPDVFVTSAPKNHTL